MWLIFLFVSIVNAKTIDESSLLELSKGKTPHNFNQLAILLEADFKKREFENTFATQINAQAMYQETKEKPLISFSPVFSPVTQAGVGLSKNFFYGISAQASVGKDKREFYFSGNTYRETMLASVNVGIDLWRDLFGLRSRSMQEQLSNIKTIKEIERETADEQFKITIRKLYWSLVANEEKYKIAKKLYEQSVAQNEETKKRYQNSIADLGDVALYASQVSSRKAQLIALEYEKTQLVKTLTNIIPELSDYQTIEIASYDVDKTIANVFQCTSVIKSFPKAPLDHTKIDEVIELTKLNYQAQTTSTNRYGDPDVKLNLGAQTKGVGDESISAWDDQDRNNRRGYTVALNVTIPLGYEDSNTKEVKLAYEKNRFLAQLTQLEVQLDSTHKSISESIGQLLAVIEAQKENNKNLLTRIAVAKTKYRQGRISLSELIRDQDNYLAGELNVVDTRLMILNTLFDYFSLYTKIPCGLNRI